MGLLVVGGTPETYKQYKTLGQQCAMTCQKWTFFPIKNSGLNRNPGSWMSSSEAPQKCLVFKEMTAHGTVPGVR